MTKGLKVKTMVYGMTDRHTDKTTYRLDGHISEQSR